MLENARIDIASFFPPTWLKLLVKLLVKLSVSQSVSQLVGQTNCLTGSSLYRYSVVGLPLKTNLLAIAHTSSEMGHEGGIFGSKEQLDTTEGSAEEESLVE